MKLRIFTIALSLTLWAAWATPAFAVDKEQRQMMADIRMLQEQAQQLQNQVQSMMTALAEAIKASDTRLTTRVDQLTDATQKALADQKTVITSISNDLRSVREKLDDNTTRVGSLTLEVQALRQLVTASRVAPPPSDSAADASQPADSAAPAAAAAPSAMGASPQKLYDSAYGDYALGQWDLAISGFQAYIRSFPQAPQADDAQVLICNAYLMDGKYDKAVDACDTAIRTYPTGDKTADAYYRKGLALQNQKQFDRAREAFEYIIKTYPDSQAASLAPQRIQELKKP
jgi:tol-pal system protein YbgF